MGDLIAIDAPPSLDLVDRVEQIWSAGNAVTVLNHRASANARRQALQRLGASAVVDEHGERTSLRGARPTEDGDALVVETSGTTSEPKGVVHTHSSLRSHANASCAALGANAEAHWLLCLPMHHIAGFSVATRALFNNATLTVLPKFDATVVSRAGHDGCTHTSLVPTALARIDAAAFETILVGGSAAPDDLPTNCVRTYGLTETCGGVVYDGVPLPGTEVDVASGNGAIRLRTPTLMRCYRDDSSPLDRDGWFSTHDSGHFDESGTLVVDGRLDDVISSGGHKIWPQRVEQVLQRHPSVAEVAVIGVPDREWGERATAVVVTIGEAPTLDQLVDLVRETLAPFDAPKRLVVVDQLPRTALGKVNRREVAAALNRTNPRDF